MLAGRRWLVLLVSLLLASWLPGCITIDLLGGRGGPLEQAVVFGKSGPKILLVDLSGPIDSIERNRSLFEPFAGSTAAGIREIFDAAREDPEIRAVLLRIDSPGGLATASDLIHEEVLRFKQEREVPVLAQIMSMAASGGYYVAVAADEIVAHPTSMTGSIGVIFFGMSAAGLMEKLGIENQAVMSDPNKDVGSPWTRMSDEERAMMQRLVDALHARFVTVVDAGRPALSAEQVEPLADGSVYSAQEALEAGLVDEIGTVYDSVERLKQRAGLTDARVVRYHRRSDAPANLYMQALRPAGLDWSSLLGMRQPVPGFHYLWWPGAR